MLSHVTRKLAAPRMASCTQSALTTVTRPSPVFRPFSRRPKMIVKTGCVTPPRPAKTLAAASSATSPAVATRKSREKGTTGGGLSGCLGGEGGSLTGTLEAAGTSR